MNDKTKKGAKVGDDELDLTPTREQLDVAIDALPGDYTDADYVVRSMRGHFGNVFTAVDESKVRELVKPTGTLEKHISSGAVGGVAPPAIIRPTIGRQVWYWRDMPKTPDLQPEAATVCYVQGDSLVNLQVVGHNGVARSEIDVSLRQPPDPEWTGRHCEWMPFQKGQAAKVEQLEKATGSAS